ncbi:MAG: DUF624 domain-containing protein [Anaerolineales bacterium]|nr:DUF624 domain-containing protein [Anaerolineales bacterium]
MAWPIVVLSLKLFYRRLGIFLVANLLWLLVSLPLVTIPAATAALFHLTQRVIAEERDLDLVFATRQHFWEGLHLHWRRATILGYLDVTALLLLVVTIRFYWTHPVVAFSWLVGPLVIMLLVLLGMQIYLFPVLLNYPNDGMRPLFRRAFFLTLSHPLDTAMLLIWLTLLTAVCITLAGPVLFVLFSLLALIQSMNLRSIRIQRGEIPPDKADRPVKEP